MKLPIPEGILRAHTIIFGMTGAGKSSVARLCVEHILDGPKALNPPLTIVDPKGDWWGLRSSADGNGKGYPVVIFGGDHGDLPLAPTAGAAVAEAVLSGAYTSLLDLSLLTLSERTRFYTDFATAYYRGRTLRYLVIDEVHNFCPKGKIPDPQVGKMLHISNTIASEGRGRGIIMLAASQRPQKVHNDFSSSCSTLIAMKVMHPADRQAYKDWLDGTGDKQAAAEILGTAAHLTKGTGWVWCVGEEPFGPTKVSFPKYKTFDSFKPQAATMKVTGQALPDLDKLRGQMAAYLEQQKQNDPAELRKRIADLERQVKNGAIPAPLPVPGPSPEQHRSILEQTTKLAAAEAWEKGFDTGAKKAHLEARERINTFMDYLEEHIRTTRPSPLPPTFIDPMPQFKTFHQVQYEHERKQRAPPPPLNRAQPQDRVVSEGLTKGQQKILDTLLWLAQAGFMAPPRTMLSVVGAYRGGAFERSLGELKTKGLIAYEGQHVNLTASGRDMAVADDSGMTIVQKLRANIRKERHLKIFDAVVQYGPVSRQDISEHIKYRGGAYERSLGELKTMGVVVYQDGGMVALPKYVNGPGDY